MASLEALHTLSSILVWRPVRLLHGSKCSFRSQSSTWEGAERQQREENQNQSVMTPFLAPFAVRRGSAWFLSHVDWNRVDMHEREREKCLIASHFFSPLLSPWLICDSNFVEETQTILLCSPPHTLGRALQTFKECTLASVLIKKLFPSSLQLGQVTGLSTKRYKYRRVLK